ncbi:MAG: MFS transporter [Clostridia bacterium]|nr:MFS transporter [Clostridia bacterium]
MKLLINLFVIVAFFDMFTQLPIITPMAKDLGAAPFVMGLAVAVYSVTNMLGNVLAGRSIDRIGAKKVLTLGLGLTALILLVYTRVKTGQQLVLLRSAHGLTAGLLAPSAFTLMAQLTKAGREGKDMAQSGAVVGTAAILGPAFSGIVGGRLGLSWIFVFVSLLMLACAALAGLVVPGQLHRPGTGGKREEETEGFSFLFKNRSLVNAYIGCFAVTFTLGVVTYVLPLKVQELSLGVAAAGTMISTFGIVAIAVFLLPTNNIFDRYDPQKLTLAGMVIISLSLAVLAVVVDAALIYGAMGIFGLGFAFMFPSMNNIIVRSVAENHRGKAFGLFYALFSLGVIAGSMGVGALNLGLNAAYLFGSGVMFILAVTVGLRVSRVAS